MNLQRRHLLLVALGVSMGVDRVGKYAMAPLFPALVEKRRLRPEISGSVIGAVSLAACFASPIMGVLVS